MNGKVTNKRYCICGASSFSYIKNFGDQLIKSIFEGWIHEIAPGSTVTLLPHKKIFRDEKIRTTAISCAEKLVFVGGGYFGEPSYVNKGFIGSLVRRILWGERNRNMYCAVAKTAVRLKVPYAIFAVEFGPITNPLYRRNAVQFFNQAQAASVRTQESLDFLRQYGVQKEVPLNADVALTLQRNSLPTECELPIEMNRLLLNGKINIGLHIPEIESNFKKKKLISIIDQVIKNLGGKNRLNLVYIHDQSVEGKPKQKALRAEAILSDRYPGLYVYRYSSHWPLVGIISKMGLILTGKLHVGIVARVLGSPTISVFIHPKVPRFFRLINEEWRCFVLGEEPMKEIQERLKRITDEVTFGSKSISVDMRMLAQGNRILLKAFLES